MQQSLRDPNMWWPECLSTEMTNRCCSQQERIDWIAQTETSNVIYDRVIGAAIQGWHRSWKRPVTSAWAQDFAASQMLLVTDVQGGKLILNSKQSLLLWTNTSVCSDLFSGRWKQKPNPKWLVPAPSVRPDPSAPGRRPVQLSSSGRPDIFTQNWPVGPMYFCPSCWRSNVMSDGPRQLFRSNWTVLSA